MSKWFSFNTMRKESTSVTSVMSVLCNAFMLIALAKKNMKIQRGNQKSRIEGQTIQWQDEKGQKREKKDKKEKKWSTKHYTEKHSKDGVTRNHQIQGQIMQGQTVH